MMPSFLPADTFTGTLLPEVLDAARCAELVAELERRGFHATGERYPRTYRNNDRLVFDDPELAASLFERLRERLPATLTIEGARWELCGLNARFRGCRYRDGQGFCIHRDGPHVPSDDVSSLLTVQLYLDDAPDRLGGRTRFYADRGGEVTWAQIAPRTGTAIVFDHRAWHDGEPVTRGIKHVLRTDAMYRRVATAGRAAQAGSREHVIGWHRGYAWRAIVCRDGSVASAGRDGTVRRWMHAPGSEALVGGSRVDAEPRVHELGAGSVTALVEGADGRLWCGTRSGSLFAIAGDRVSCVAKEVGAVLGAATGDGRVAFSTSRGTICIVEGDALSTISAHAGWAWSVVPHGERFLSCGEDGRVFAIDDRVRAIADLERPLRALALRSTGELLAGDTTGWVHRLGRDGEPLGALRAHTSAVTGLAIAHDGAWASCSEDGTIKHWRAQHLVATHAARDFVTSVAFDARGDLVYASYDGRVARNGMLAGAISGVSA